MKLNECMLSVTQAITAPQFVEKAEPHWIDANDNKLIPEALYLFYCTADFFSLYKAPTFLKDEKNLLFRYLGSLVNGIRTHLVDCNEYVKDIEQHQRNSYSPIKKMLKREYDKDAQEKERKVFKNMIIDLYGTLDLLSDAISIILPGEIEKLSVGKSQFSKVFKFIKKDSSNLRKENESNVCIIDPKSHFSKDLYNNLRPLFISDKPDSGWYELFRLYRHKIIHFGSSVLRQVGLHDENMESWEFLPNSWPFYYEEHISCKQIVEKDGVEHDMKGFLVENLIHEDTATFCKGLLKRVFNVHEATFSVLNEAYKLCKDMCFYQQAYDELLHSREQYSFKMFDD